MAVPNTKFLGNSNLFGQSVAPDFEYFDDFVAVSYEDGGKFSTTAQFGDWLSTETNAGAVVIGLDEPNGVLHITTDTADNDAYNLQMNGTPWKIRADKDIYFECRLKLTAAAAPLTTIDWYVGLAASDTSIMTAVTDRVGMGSNGLNAGAADIYYITEDGGTQTDGDTGVDWVDDTFVTLAFHVISNNRVKFFVNGNEKANVTTNIPSGTAMSLAIAIHNNAAAAKQMLVDYIYCAQVR